MQILLIDLSHKQGNTQAHIVALARALLDEQRTDVHICCPRNSPLARMARELHLPLCGLWGDSAVNPLNILSLWLLTRRQRYCIVHTFSAGAARLGARVMRMRQKQRTVLLHNCHNSQYPECDSSDKLPPFWAEAHSVICANQYRLKTLLHAGLDPRQLVRLPAGVDTETLTALARADQPVVPLANARRIVIGSLTGHSDSASHSVVLKAMAALWQNEKMPPWEVRIIGDCPNFRQLLDEATALGVQSRLALLGAQPLHEVLPLCNILVAPSTSPHGALPAMAAAWALSLPLLCPALPTNQEWAVHEDNALLYQGEDPQQLATSLKHLIKNTQIHQNLVKGAARTAPRTSIDVAVHHCLDVYAEHLKKRGWVSTPKASPPESATDPAPAETPAEMSAEDSTATPIEVPSLPSEAAVSSGETLVSPSETVVSSSETVVSPSEAAVSSGKAASSSGEASASTTDALSSSGESPDSTGKTPATPGQL